MAFETREITDAHNNILSCKVISKSIASSNAKMLVTELSQHSKICIKVFYSTPRRLLRSECVPTKIYLEKSQYGTLISE